MYSEAQAPGITKCHEMSFISDIDIDILYLDTVKNVSIKKDIKNLNYTVVRFLPCGSTEAKALVVPGFLIWGFLKVLKKMSFTPVSSL